MDQTISNKNYSTSTVDSNYIELINTGKFTAKFTVTCENNQNNFTIESDPISANTKKQVCFCTDSTNFSITVEVFDGLNWTEIYTLNQTSVYILQLTLTGTLSDPVCTVTQNACQLGGVPVLSLNKVPNPTTVQVGNKATVTVTIENTGDVSAQDTVLNLNIADIAQIIPPDSSSPPSSGNNLALGTIQPRQTLTLVYTVIITSMPSENPVASKPTLTYHYLDLNNDIVCKTLTGDVTPITITSKSATPSSSNSSCSCN